MIRGDVVSGDCGNAFVVWGRTGPCVHLIPLACLPANPRAQRVQVFPDKRCLPETIDKGDSHVTVWANADVRCHRPATSLELIGCITVAAQQQLLAAIEDQRRAVVDLAERRRRRNIFAAARQARARRAAA